MSADAGPTGDARLGPAPSDVRVAIVEAGRRLWDRGLVGGSEGNLSVRVDGGRVVATPSGVCKGRLDPAALVVTDLAGRPLGGGRPSSELKMHLRVYAMRPEVVAVVHAHPPIATGFAIAGRPLVDCVVPEIVATLGWVPVVPYGTPSTDELPDRMAPYVRTHDALLLANHGAVTYARSLDRAVDAMESLEQACRSLLVAQLLGGPRRLSREEVDRLLALDAYGAGARNPGCAVTDPEPLAERVTAEPGPGPAGTELERRIAAIVREALADGRR